MNRKTIFKTLLLAAFGMQMHAQSYCEPTWSGWAVNEPTEPISLVQLGVDEAVSGAINNASTALVSSDTPRYEDFSSTVMSVTRGESYTLKVKGNTDGDQTNYITVYFDWNGDGVFSNGTPADEVAQQQLTNQPEKHQHLTALVNSNGEDDLEVTHTVTIPTDAVTGEIRMRVVKNYNAPSPAPCSNPFIFGQVEDYTLNIVESTSVAVESVEVTTENNAAAEITTADGTLQLLATVTPTDASQEVTWTIESGDEFVSVDDNGLVTAIANGVATIRATLTEDNTVFDEIDVTVDIETADECESVETFLETFETFTEFPSQCWNANYTNYALSISDETVQLYSGGATDEIIIVSPEVSTIDGQHVLAFDMVSITQPGTMLQVGTMTDNTDFTTFTAVGDSFAPVGGTTHSTATIPANEGHKYVAIKYTFPANSHIVLKLDNIEWKVAASNGRFDQNRVKIYPNPTSGLFYIDTDIAVRNIEVYNAMGQKVASTQHKEVDLSNVARGTYIVRVYATDGTFAAYKVVKK